MWIKSVRKASDSKQTYFFCNVPKLAMKNHLVLCQMQMIVVLLLHTVEKHLFRRIFINLRLTVLDTDSSSYTMLGVLLL